jgi:hypothetical protein
MTLGLSSDNETPTPVKAEEFAIGWIYEDDFASCSENPTITGKWYYREYGASEWNEQDAIPWEWMDAFVLNLANMTENGPFEFMVSVTDCAEQTTYSPVRYIILDLPPSFTFGPVRVDPLTLGLSQEPVNPTPVEPGYPAVGWIYEDDKVMCDEDPGSFAWEYREYGATEWIEDNATHWGWMDAAVTDFSSFSIGDGPYEFRAKMTDCAGQTSYSLVYYIRIDSLPPQASINASKSFMSIANEIKNK